MTERSTIAYLNGDWIPATELHVPVTDLGFMQGVTVAEQLRTFAGKLFRLESHLQRLARSLEIVSVDLPDGVAPLAEAATHLAAHNHALLEPGDDLGLSIFVTPGDYATFGTASGPRVAMHTYPVPFQMWADKYDGGQWLAVPAVRQVPTTCWPAELKCRSRMHYYLADREAARKVPGSRALILDQDDSVLEATTANIVVHFAGEGIVSPPTDSILPGISVSFLRQMAGHLNIDFTERVLRLDDLLRADEVLLTSTSPCVLPVVGCDATKIGDGVPGPVFRQLIAAWSEHVGVDVIEQARRFRQR